MSLQCPWHSSPAWQPSTFLQFGDSLDTSMGTARIETDAGPAYLKALGNRQGPQPLAVELVATQLAKWFGLPVLDHAVIEIDADVDEIPLARGRAAESGPAFVTRAVTATPWGGSTDELTRVVNAEEIGRLVVFDTWLLNCDRYPPDLTVRKPNYDNVLLEVLTSKKNADLRLLAMDHTHCLTCGRDLGAKIATIDRIKDKRLYGLFPGFVPYVRQEAVQAAVGKLAAVDRSVVEPIVSLIPHEWEVDPATRTEITELIVRRAQFVADSIEAKIASKCWPNHLFDKK